MTTNTASANARLEDATYSAAKTAFSELFRDHPGTFYYCSMFTDGLANGPAITAWSYEALDECVAQGRDANAKEWLKWSYGESPFFCYRDDLFEPIRKMFQSRGGWGSTDWNAEFEDRLMIMENVMRKLDGEHVFGEGEQRKGLVVAVELIPPDASNTDRVKRLNPPEAAAIWMKEYANS